MLFVERISKTTTSLLWNDPYHHFKIGGGRFDYDSFATRCKINVEEKALSIPNAKEMDEANGG